MRLLVVVLNYRGFFRFVSPILAELKKQDTNAEIIVLAPDIEQFREGISQLPYMFIEPAQSNSKFTQKFRQVRTVLAYLYWSLIGVQSELVLERMGKKFFTAQAQALADVIKPRQILSLAKFLAFTRTNRFVAKSVFTFLRLLEKLTPADRRILKQVYDLAPDIIMATPSLYPQHYDVDYIKAGLKSRIPTVSLIASWDHLSSKGLLSLLPDKLFLWSPHQIDEAHDFHGVPMNRMQLIGAPSFDWLFDKQHLIDRSEFCAKAGFNPALPYILWAASAPGNCRDEKLVVKLLLEEIRKYSVLQDYQLLIRPHPNDPAMWKDWSEAGTVVWNTPQFPYKHQEYIDLYNSIYHAQVVTGLSTSVFLETSILDRPCAIIKQSLAVPETVFNQTLHFKYMVEHGYPHATENERDFARWLTRIAQGDDTGRCARAEIVKTLLRPVDVNCPAAEIAANAVLNIFESQSKSSAN